MSVQSDPPFGAIFNAPADTDLAGPNGEPIRQLRVAGAGTLEVVMSNGSTGIIAGVIAGEYITGRIRRIVSGVGTTATGFTAFY